MSKIYRDYSQEELDRQYEQRTLVPAPGVYTRSWRERTDEVKGLVDNMLDVPYGDHPDERLDIYLASGNSENGAAPIQIFAHGGAWRGSSKEDAGGPAPVFTSAGAIYVALEFSLAPAANLDRMVNQVRRAIKFIYDTADKYEGARERIFLSGHSSGAHLASMATVTDWEGDFGVPDDIIKGVTLASGPFDLEPVRLSARNDYLSLDEDMTQRNSAYLYLPGMTKKYLPPALFAWGGKELDEFQRQSRELSHAWEKTGFDVQRFFFEERNHFEMLDEFSTPGPLVAAMLSQMNLA